MYQNRKEVSNRRKIISQKIILFFSKKLLTNVLAFDKIGLALRKSQNNNADARVAQLVEHDLAKVGAAGSSPVSRSCLRVGKP